MEGEVIIVLGDSEVGKASIINMLVGNKFSFLYNATMAFNATGASLKNWKGEEFAVEFLELSGHEIFAEIRSSMNWNPKAAIIVIDSTRQETLYNIDEWIGIVRNEGLSNENIIICMNKIDMVDFLAMRQNDIMRELTEYLMSPEIIISSANTKVGRQQIIDTLKELTRIN